jgi:hypothetical protein
MERTLVNSSNVRAVGYDPVTFTLVIEFANGRSYEYGGVHQTTYHALMSAESVGKYFMREIRGKYPEAEVSVDAPERL